MGDHDHQKELCRDWGLYSLYELLSMKFDKLENQIKNAMATVNEAIAAFATKQNAHNTKIDAAIAGLIADNQYQTDLIKKLQDAKDELSPASQAILDDLDARQELVVSKLEALDALTPPVVPPTP